MKHAIMQSRLRERRAAVWAALAAPVLLLLLPGCGQYAGGDPPTAQGTTTATAVAPPDPTVAMNSFATTVYPVLTQYCGPQCHVGGGTEGTPHIAHPDLPTAYRAVVDQQKVSFSNPAASRLVRRLVADFHHCWSSCMADGAVMEAAITAWAADIAASGGGGTPVAGGLFSNALTLANGQEDLGDRRYSGNLIALYEFKEGSGSVASDTSGVDPAMDLDLQGDVTWMTSYGISIQPGGSALGSDAGDIKLFDRIARAGVGTQQYSIEAWVIPDNTDQEGPARIVTYSRNTNRRNFTLGQVLYQYDFRNRALTPDISLNGTPSLQTYDGDQDLQATLQHVVVTYDQFRGRRIYVNGRWTDDLDERDPGRLWNWEESARFVIGDEVTGERQWLGKVQLLAIYDHALTEAQIRQNFDAGVGKRLLLTFDISSWLGPGSRMEVSVREFDDYSYLFCTPTLVTPGATGFRVQNLRIMVNGSIPVQGQAFVRMDELVTASRQVLAPTCSIVPKVAGPDSDEFALAFEVLGNYEDPVDPEVFPPGGVVVYTDPLPNNGIRDFARINETMAAVTGVSPLTSTVNTTYQSLTQQLPSGYDLRAFSSSQQVGVTKLALEYCDQAVDSTTLRAQLAPGFQYDQPVATALDAAGQATLIQGMTEAILGQNAVTPLTSQPSVAEVMPALQTMIGELTAQCGVSITCDATRTQTIAKATCTALLSSAAATIH